MYCLSWLSSKLVVDLDVFYHFLFILLFVHQNVGDFDNQPGANGVIIIVAESTSFPDCLFGSLGLGPPCF